MFLLSQNDENQSENGSKNSKIRLRARPPAEMQKKMLQTKKLRSKSWKTRVFFTFRLPILDGRVHEQVSSVLFFTVFFEGERHDLSKTGGFGRKMPPPRDGLLGTMRQKAFNRNDLEREKKHSSSGYSSSSIITCCYALALHLYLSTHLLLWIKFLLPRSQ